MIYFFWQRSARQLIMAAKMMRAQLFITVPFMLRMEHIGHSHPIYAQVVQVVHIKKGSML